MITVDVLVVALFTSTTAFAVLTAAAWWHDPSTRRELRQAVIFSALSALHLAAVVALFLAFALGGAIDYPAEVEAVLVISVLFIIAMHVLEVARGLSRLRTHGGEIEGRE